MRGLLEEYVRCLSDTLLLEDTERYVVSISLRAYPSKVRLLISPVDRSLRSVVSPASVAFCRNCERFLNPPQNWTIARPESSELLSICLRKLKGLNKVRLTDAHFIWTEPHSKRLRVSVTIQKEVRGILQLYICRLT